ncbi:virulence-associated E family protein [Enterococcus faecalis]|uniref:virulence-associated E family protein n=1 Tax=Enterococcus faecalis TaxID=1351 RepID=UPI002DB84AFD|nr:virulence-associated E family protein [Enterococcus faecalis]MEB5927214.1 virulence-associated E family protein [Enterococcus faecalis]
MSVNKDSQPIHRIKYDGQLNYAEGKSRTTLVWKNKTFNWSDLLKTLENPVETYETPEEYKSFPKAKKDEIKDVGGIVGGWLKEGKRKRGYVQQRSMVILDADSTTSELWEDTKLLFSNAVAICTTHSHTKEEPRYRLFFPLSRPVTAEEYEPLARKIADTLGMDNFDDTTYQAERLMHKPSHSKGGDYFFSFQDGEWLNPDEILSEYEDWRDVSFWPESSRCQKVRKRQAKKAGDPLEKKGIVGAFCRTYDIVSAIETFLPDVYGPTGREDRWTYLEGSTSGGLVAYDDKFAYSHHGTDPVGNQLANAFDLVRIHLFGDLDDSVTPNTPVNRYPSYMAMREFAENDKEVKKELVRERFREANEDFGNIEDELGENDDWITELRYNTRGTLDSSIYNGYLFLENLPSLKQGVVYNEFSHRIEKVKKFPWEKEKGLEWSDNDTVLLRAYLDETKKFKVDKNTIMASLLQSANTRRHHPVKTFIEAEKWDGTKRIERIFIDYLGVEDTEYTREVTKKWFTGAVARIYRPGVKFEIVPILSGAQGVGKSTLVNKLAPDFFSDGLRGLGETKDDLQFLIGSWLLEISELSAMKKTEVEKTKQFISAREDRFRVVYGDIPQRYPRTCVFIGTSNPDQYLKDKTGNRRFYPLPCERSRQKKTVFDGSLEKIVPQIWAEAKHYYDNGEALYLREEIEKVAREKQQEAMVEDIAEKIIYEYLEIELPENWYQRPTADRVQFIQDVLNGEENVFEEENVKFTPRLVVTSKEIYQEAFNKPLNNVLDARSNSDIRKIGLIMNSHPGWKQQAYRMPENKEKVVKGFKRL